MTEENTAVVNQAAIDEARQLSGEANNVKFDFTPLIEIDNSKVEEELSDGRKTKVLVEPRFVFTTKNEAGEYIKTPYNNAVKGTVLKVRYMVDKKYEENSQTPYYRSNEFDSFQGKNVVLRSGETTSPAYTYKDFKAMYEKKFNLWTIVYFLMANEEGEKKVFKLKMKGVSRSNFWDYMATFGNNDSITVHETEVSFEVDDAGENPFNYACFEKTTAQINVEEALMFGRELRDALNSFNSPPATQGEVVQNTPPVQPAGQIGVAPAADPVVTEERKEEVSQKVDNVFKTMVENNPAPVREESNIPPQEEEKEVVVNKIPF